jgi:hypothetical protein
MRKYRDFFDKIVLVWHVTYGHLNYSKEIEGYMKQDDITTFDLPRHSAAQSWKDVGNNAALNICTSKHVLLLEHDIIYHNDKFWEIVLNHSHPLVGWKEGAISNNYITEKRFHPSFLLVERELLEKTSKNFSEKKGVYDVYGGITPELQALAETVYLEELGLVRLVDWEHIRGCSYDYSMVQNNKSPLARRNNFRLFNQMSLEVEIEKHPAFLPIIRKCAQ